MAAPVIESYNSNTVSSSASITITKPTGLAVGNLLVAYITSISTSHTPQTPSGWTEQFVFQMINGNQNFYHSCFTKVADATDVAASNFTFTLSTAVNGIAGTLFRISGVASGNEIEGVEISRDTDGGTTASFTTTGTPRMSDSLLLISFAKHDDGGTVSNYASTPAKTWTEKVDIEFTVGGYVPAYAIASATAGSTTQVTAFQATLSSNSVTVVGSLLRINAVVNATGSNTLVTTTSIANSQSGIADATAQSTLIQATSISNTQSGKGTSPTQWQNETANPTTWTNETI